MATTFWKARFAQGILVFLLVALIAPFLWNVITLILNNLLYDTALPLLAALTNSVYPRSLLGGLLFAICLAFRSISWGKITWFFALSSGLMITLLLDLILRFLPWFLAHDLPKGFGHEPLLSWLFAWGVAALLSYGLLRLTGLSERYKESERFLLLASLWIVVVFALYVPSFYTLLLLVIILKDELPFFLAQGPLSGAIEPISLVLAAAIAFTLVAVLRRKKTLSKRLLLIVPLIATALLMILHLCAVSIVEWQIWIVFYGVFAVLLAATARLFIPLLMDAGSTRLAAKQEQIKQSSLPFLLVVMLTLIAAPLWQSLTILWRTLIFGMPPSSFFLAQINWAVFFAAIFFALPVALYAGFRNEINFSVMFIIAIFAGFLAAFFPAGYMGLDFGLWFNHFCWPMLSFGPLCLICWAILSLMKQIRRL